MSDPKPIIDEPTWPPGFDPSDYTLVYAQDWVWVGDEDEPEAPVIEG